MARWAVVLAGGAGTRFWPLSTPVRPKQLLPLATDDPLLVQAVRRLEGLIDRSRIVVVTGHALAEPTRQALSWLEPEQVLAEPRAASTGPALAWATAHVGARDPQASILSLHADWWVGDDEAFRRSAAHALEAAERHDRLVTVGVVPSRPDTGYGYIEPGDALDATARSVRRFTEKPDRGTAEQLIECGALWNSGMFAWTVARFQAETLAHSPEMAPHLELLAHNDVERFFSAVTPIAVDVSHYERSNRVAVVTGEFPWDDVGTWAALRRVRKTDGAGNMLAGDAHVRDTTNSVAWADDGSIVLDGVSDLVVVRANGVTLVTTAARSSNLKDLLAALPERLRTPSP